MELVRTGWVASLGVSTVISYKSPITDSTVEG